MTICFLDSSALIKRYVNEPGTTWIRSITRPSARNTIFVAHITQVEIISGAMRQRREGLLSTRTARATRLLVDRHFSRQYRVIGLTDKVVQLALDVLERHALRASDAIQLATALESQERLESVNGQSGLEFISADTRLLAAATSEGLLTVDPNQYA